MLIRSAPPFSSPFDCPPQLPLCRLDCFPFHLLSLAGHLTASVPICSSSLKLNDDLVEQSIVKLLV